MGASGAEVCIACLALVLCCEEIYTLVRVEFFIDTALTIRQGEFKLTPNPIFIQKNPLNRTFDAKIGGK